MRNKTQIINQWSDWKWQLKNSIRTIEDFIKISGINLSPEEIDTYKLVSKKFPISITPYYFSLINKENYLNDPVFKQCFCSKEEIQLSEEDLLDPLAEEHDSPAPCITHRYPDRVLFLVSNCCAMYCRHCTRKRKVGDIDRIPSKLKILEGMEYISSNKKIRDVLLSGGDPFLLSDEYLDWILGLISSIEHVEVIRIGTRTPVVLPQRITPGLIKVLKKYKNLWINTHFNHAQEITSESSAALKALVEAGIPMGNQSVLLAGVNDCPRIMLDLVQKLVKNRVRPYYLYQCDLSEGLAHFRTPVSKGIEIMEHLRGHTSGFAVPTYVVDAPGGGGKIPLMPNYHISSSDNKIILRNFEGRFAVYTEPKNYKPHVCDNYCKKIEEKINVQGISSLLKNKSEKVNC